MNSFTPYYIILNIRFLYRQTHIIQTFVNFFHKEKKIYKGLNNRGTAIMQCLTHYAWIEIKIIKNNLFNPILIIIYLSFYKEVSLSFICFVISGPNKSNLITKQINARN